MEKIILLISIISALIIFLLSFTRVRKPLEYLFYFWILSFSFGPRRTNLFGIEFFYIEGITLLVFLAFLLRIGRFLKDVRKTFPRYTWLLFLWCIVGYIVALYRKVDWTTAFNEFKIFIFILPVFYITYVGFKYLEVKLEKIVAIFLISALILTMGSVIPYFFPELLSFIPQRFIRGDSILLDANIIEVPQRGDLIFKRGTGSFWGSLLLSAYLLILLFPVYMRSASTKNDIKKIAYIFASFLMFIVIVTNGHRSVWSGFLFGLAFLSLMKGLKGLFYGTISIAAITFLLPPEAIARFLTIFEVSDISWTGRVTRYKFALQLIKESPILGMGFGGSGWVHSAVLQIGANLGLVGLCLFLLWIGRPFFRSIYIYREFSRKTSLKIYHLGFLTSIIAFWGPLVGESTINQAILMIPFWFFCAVLQNFNNGSVFREPEKSNFYE